LIRVNAIESVRGMLSGETKESIMMNWPNWYAGWSDGYFALPMFMHLVWYAALIGLAAALAAYVMKRSGNGSGRPSALDVLKERYARGELTKDDFDRMRKDILV
jgi:putative membrane protein